MKTIQRTWKRDNSIDRMDADAAIKNLQTNAADEALRAANHHAIYCRLDRGDCLETPLAVFCLPGEREAVAAAVARKTFKLGERRRIFRALVAEQDRGLSASTSYDAVCGQWSISAAVLRAIEDEGLARDWPLDKGAREPEEAEVEVVA